MKTILLIFIPFFILFSCHTPKNVIQHSKVDQQTKVEQNTIQKNDIVDTKKDQTDANKTVKDLSKGSTEKVTKMVTYDTNKPSDPNTGKPPVLSESVTIERNTDNKDIQTDFGVTIKKEDSHKDKSKTETVTNGQVNTSENNKVKEKTKPPAVKYYLWILIIAIVSIVGFFIYRKRTKIKALFSFLS